LIEITGHGQIASLDPLSLRERHCLFSALPPGGLG
jgi:hypothetical protein